MTTKKWLKCGACLLAGLLAGRVAAEDTATVNQEKLNVRGQPSIFSEVVTQLKKGETVVVLEEIKHDKPKPADEAKWLRIALPANTPVWLNATFVSNNIVQPKTLNIRSGPGENFSVIGRVDKGTEIKEIRTVEGWMEIVAPTNTYAFVAAPYVTRGDAKLADKTEKPAPAKLTEEKKMEVKPSEPTPITTVETVKPEPLLISRPDNPLRPQPPVLAPVQETKVTPPPAPVVVESKPVVPKLDPNAVVVTPAPAAPATPPPAPVETVTDGGPPAKRIVVREGEVRRTISIQAPSPYRLADVESGRTIDYLYVGNTGLELKYYLGKKIRISGEEALDERWRNTPLITIQTLQVVP